MTLCVATQGNLPSRTPLSLATQGFLCDVAVQVPKSSGGFRILPPDDYIAPKKTSKPYIEDLVDHIAQFEPSPTVPDLDLDRAKRLYSDSLKTRETLKLKRLLTIDEKQRLIEALQESQTHIEEEEIILLLSLGLFPIAEPDDEIVLIALLAAWGLL